MITRESSGSGIRGICSRVFAYTLIGGTAAMLELLLFQLLDGIVGSVTLRAAASFLVAVVFNYFVSSFVFGVDPYSKRRAALFASTMSLGLVVNAGMTGLLADAASWPPLVAKIGGIGCAFAVNLTLSTMVVFRR